MAEEKNKETVEEENKVEETNKAEEVNSDNVEKNERTGLENLKVLENIDVKLTVEVGGAEIKLRELLRINEGSVIELERLAGDPLDILANGTIIAKGEVVMIGERFGVRFTEVVDPKEKSAKFISQIFDLIFNFNQKLSILS